DKARFAVLGDFNVDILVESEAALAFRSLVEVFGVILSINEHTRITETSSSCLDNVITNVGCEATVVEEHLSDHSAQRVVLDYEGPPQGGPKNHKVRVINENIMRAFKEKLSE
ncbi:hypothetical protein HHI36_000732, partial [Cryptolaemus montrouzieri]